MTIQHHLWRSVFWKIHPQVLCDSYFEVFLFGWDILICYHSTAYNAWSCVYLMYCKLLKNNRNHIKFLLIIFSVCFSSGIETLEKHVSFMSPLIYVTEVEITVASIWWGGWYVNKLAIDRLLCTNQLIQDLFQPLKAWSCLNNFCMLTDGSKILFHSLQRVLVL